MKLHAAPRPDASPRLLDRVAPGDAPVIQTKMRVGRSDDPLEFEADRVADQVVRALASPGPVAASDASDGGRVRRATTIRRAPAGTAAPIGPAGGPVDDDVASRLRRATTGGTPLDQTTSARMGAAFGADFSSVRVHRGAESDALNRSLGARAFTTGSHVFLGSDAPAPGTTQGDHLLAHELTHTIQQGGATTAAGGAVGRVQRSAVAIQRDDKVEWKTNPLYQGDKVVGGENPLYEPPAATVYPIVGQVRGEAVIFDADGDEAEAERIMNTCETVYKISIRSDKLAKAIPSNYKKAPKDVRAAIEAGVWQMKELRGIERALAHFAPILGSARKDSTRKGSQEVKYIGKVKKAIDENSADGVLDSTTLGEYFKKDKTLGLFDAGTDSTVDFADSLTQLEGTAVHEMAHGLFKYLEDPWLQEFDFWAGFSTPSGKKGEEAPPSKYGHTNVAEDMCESVMFYFVDENRLKTTAPLRHAFLKTEIGKWKKENKKAKKK